MRELRKETETKLFYLIKYTTVSIRNERTPKGDGNLYKDEYIAVKSYVYKK